MAGIVALAVATPMLLALYFLKLRRRPVRVSSTMFWSQAAKDLQVNAPLQWIRLRWSLVLQLAGLVALAGALARPAIPASGSVGARIILVLDTSASMGAIDNRAGATAGAPAPSRLERAKDEAAALVRRLPRGAEAMVVSFAASPRIEAAFTSDRALLSEAVRGIAQTDQPDDIARAAALLEAALKRATDESGAGPAATSIVLFSDGGFAQGDKPVVAALGGADVRFVRLGSQPGALTRNVGIAAIAAERDFNDAQTLRLLVRFANAGPTAVDVATGVFLNGEPVGALSAPTPPAGALGPGEAVAALTLRTRAGGVISVRMAPGDALAADDEAFVVVPPATALRVAVAHAAGASADPFLLRALDAAGAASVQTLDIASYDKRAATSALLSWDIIVFDRVAPARLPRIPSLTLGAVPPIAGLTFAPGPTADRFAAWDRTDPLLRDVALDAIALAAAPTLTIDDSIEAEDRTRALARATRGALIAAARGAFATHVVVSFALAQSTWPLDPSFAIFIANILEQLPGGGDRLRGKVWSTHDSVVVTLAPGARSVHVDGPAPRDVAAPKGAARVAIGVLPRAGLYTIAGASDADTIVGASVLDARESSLASEASVRVAGEDRMGEAAAALAPREIWRWWIAIAAALLSIDWFLYAFAMRVRPE